MGNENKWKTTYLPKDTLELLKVDSDSCNDNNYLNFHRYVKEGDKEKIEPFKESCIKIDPLKKMLKRQRKLQQLAIKAFENVLTFQIDFEDKLMVSVGENSIYSNLSTTVLHPLYGHPYLPSSALKGVIRHCWIHERFDGSQEKALQDSLFVRCFGKSDDKDEATVESQRGKLIFFDGIINKDLYSLQRDFVTPHYPDYYNNEGEKEPTDDQNLNILEIMVLKAPTFMINIAMSDLFLAEEVDEIKTIIKIAFEDYGVGAKTAVGYGLGNVRGL